MNTNELNRLRSKIEATLATLQTTASNAKSEIKTSSEVNPNAFQDELDCAKGEIDLKTALEIHNHSVAQQNLLKQALDRMEDGTFGVCLTCSEDIGIRRLNVHPGAVRCIDCQECREVGVVPEPKSIPSANHIQIRWAA